MTTEMPGVPATDTSGGTTDRAADLVLVGFDGSRGAARAIATAALLLPRAAARVVTVWTPASPDPVLRHRVTRLARTLDRLGALMEQESAADAEQTAAEGAALARAAGWSAEPVTHRAYADPGAVLAGIAGDLHPRAVVVGARGLGGTAAVMGSVSDLAAHHSPVPVLVVPPLLSHERAAAATGPVLVGHDGSPGAEHARDAAAALLPHRDQVLAHVHHGGTTERDGDIPSVAVDLHAHGRGARAVANALDAAAAERDAGVVVIGSRGRSALREMVLGSTAMAVLHHVHRPVLVVPRHASQG
ncbi:universal stress protein [Actinomycetospora straminea]|uniref:Universal stress protein n=1 Tax=Actinomycetospora straminea TaxID=663607 RepID=A0ABP9ETF0_9PSEU|nr:universal stress protein [Actinomycetospora straminea]MDD7933195.1 universal stress protein [Actinomycetospora straminea]